MSLHRRLKALEARAGESEAIACGRGLTERSRERYFHAIENARREIRGLEALPDLPYTEEDYHDDLNTLEHSIPTMRAEPGWRGDRERSFLDEWEREVRERVTQARCG